MKLINGLVLEGDKLLAVIDKQRVYHGNGKYKKSKFVIYTTELKKNTKIFRWGIGRYDLRDYDLKFVSEHDLFQEAELNIKKMIVLKKFN